MVEIVQGDVSLEWCPFNDLLMSVVHAAVGYAMTYIGEVIVQPPCALCTIITIVVAAVMATELFNIIVNSFGTDACQQWLYPSLVT